MKMKDDLCNIDKQTLNLAIDTRQVYPVSYAAFMLSYI